MSVTTRITVQGMSCEHCVSAVTNEVNQLDGVTGVDVDLATGAVEITSHGPLSEAAVRDAIVEAGYELAS